MTFKIYIRVVGDADTLALDEKFTPVNEKSTRQLCAHIAASGLWTTDKGFLAPSQIREVYYSAR